MDGLDKDLIEMYECPNITLDEFGAIDNDTDICVRVTTELYTSFLSGETWREHGVIGLDRYRSDILNKIESLNKYKLFRKFTGMRNRIYKEIPLISAKKRHVCYQDYTQKTIFEKIPSSKAIGVRGYNKGYTVDLMMLLEEFGVKEAHQEMDRWEKSKENELFEALEQDYDLIMAHFHRPDYIHHWYWEVGEEETVKQTYEYMDNLAGKIKKKGVENGFDRIIFLSDHGLPSPKEGAHNKNAFYSCNKELFSDITPHITDFHDKIVDLGFSETKELEGVEI